MKKTSDKNQGGFKMPDNYLAGLEDKIMRSALKQSGSHERKDLGFEKHFSVPPAYFDELEERLLAKTKGRVIRLPRPGKTTLTLISAASIALLFALGYWAGDQSAESWTDLKDKDINSIVDEDYGMFSASDIADAFEDIDLESEIYADMEIEDYLEEIDLENIITEN